MTFLRVIFTIAISFLYVAGFDSYVVAASPGLNSSFKKLVGDTEWEIKLKDFGLRLEKGDNTFKLNMSDGNSFGFSAFKGKDNFENRFGPLNIEYKDSLTRLLEQGILFSGQKKSGQFAMGMDWWLYPQSIKKWAKTWQNSSLKEKWDKTEQNTRYKSLTIMISGFLKEEMQPVANVIGFEVTGADMEKMAYYPAGKLKFNNKVLKIKGISSDLKIPIPLMLRILLKPLPGQETTEGKITDSKVSCEVDSLFATAKLNSTYVYCTYINAFNEYEIAGDTLDQNGTYARIHPMYNKVYKPIAGKLFQACLKASQAGKKEAILLRLSLQQYPKLYQQVIKHFTFISNPAKEILRSGLEHIKFYEYKPERESAYQVAVDPFLKENGYMFRSFVISFNSDKQAKKYTDHEETFKSLGIKPNDKPFVPDITCMRIELKK